MPTNFDMNELDLPEDSQVETLMQRCPDIRAIVYHDGDYLMKEGEESQEIYVILQGSYVVEHEKEGEEPTRGQPLAVQFSDEEDFSFVGEMAYMGSHKRTASVRCAGSVHALVLRTEHLDIILDEFSYFARVLSKQMAVRLKEADRIIKRLRADLEINASHTFKKDGETVINAGEPASDLYRLVDGSLIKGAGENAETITASRSPRDFVNAREYFTKSPNEASFRAKGPVILSVIDGKSQLAVIRNFPELPYSLLNEPG